MADRVAELLLPLRAVEKLGARGISIDEASQLRRNAHVTVRNPRAGGGARRRLLVGRTDGDRVVTLVIERTRDSGTWVVVTGWDSHRRERRLLRGER